MKKVILTTIIALTTVAGAMAQNVEVTATVVNQAITFTSTDVAFGNIEANEASYLKANASDLTATANSANATAGALQIQGSNKDVEVTWANATLTDGDGENPATFTPTVYNDTAAVSSGGSVTISGGSVTLDIGGSLTAIVNAGTYSTANGGGTAAVFTVSYVDV